jgi:hypothetical protein
MNTATIGDISAGFGGVDYWRIQDRHNSAKVRFFEISWRCSFLSAGFTRNSGAPGATRSIRHPFDCVLCVPVVVTGIQFMGTKEKSELRLLCRKVGLALLRLAFLAVFMGAHYLLNKALLLVMPSNMMRFVEVAQSVIAIMFLLIYLYLAWDMVTVFMPWLSRPDQQIQLEASQAGKSSDLQE